MILKCPFRYAVTGRKHGNVRISDYEVWETMPLEIREVSPNDAPVAISWDDRFPEGLLLDDAARSEWGPHSLTGDAHTVFFEDCHWVALNNDEGIYRAAGGYGPCLTDEIASQLVQEKDCPLLNVEGFDARARRQVVEHDNDGHSMFAGITHSSRNLLIERRQKMAQDIMAVNGRLYRKCDEPKLWLMVGTTHPNRTSSGDGYLAAVIRVATKVKPRRDERTITPGGRLYFSIAEAEELFEVASQYNRDRSQLSLAMTDRNLRAMPVLHQAHTVDEEGHTIQRIASAAREFLGFAMDYKLGALPRSTAYHVLDLKGHMENLDNPGGLVDFEETVLGLYQEVGSNGHPLGRALRHIEEMVSLFESRAINVDIASATAGIAP